MRRYRQRVTFQEAQWTRTPAGQQVVGSWENVTGLTDLPATVIVETDENRGERMTLTTDLYRIIVAGDRRTVTDTMAVQDGVAVYDFVRIEPTLGRRSTVVVAQRVTP